MKHNDFTHIVILPWRWNSIQEHSNNDILATLQTDIFKVSFSLSKKARKMVFASKAIIYYRNATLYTRNFESHPDSPAHHAVKPQPPSPDLTILPQMYPNADARLTITGNEAEILRLGDKGGNATNVAIVCLCLLMYMESPGQEAKKSNERMRLVPPSPMTRIRRAQPRRLGRRLLTTGIREGSFVYYSDDAARRPEQRTPTTIIPIATPNTQFVTCSRRRRFEAILRLSVTSAVESATPPRSLRAG